MSISVTSRTVRAELLDRFPPVGGFCDHGHIRLNPDEADDPFAHHGMVVDGENANWGAAGHDAFPHTLAGGLDAKSRDHQVRLGDVA
jgi:hypothetical protein